MSTTATRTVTVNAAFLQEIKEDDRQLNFLLERVSGELCDARTGAGRLRRLVEVLLQLRDRLSMHFSLEEAYGYFEDAVAVAPRLSDRADALRSEHQVMFLGICRIVEDAEGLLYREKLNGAVQDLTDALDRFLKQFRDHEAPENELIAQSLGDDIGVGD